MSNYKITDYSFQQAIKHGLKIKPSTNKNKKIDVFKNDIKIASIGDINYSDYGHYLEKNGITYANEKRRLYKIRHKKDMMKYMSNGYLSGILLW